MKNGSSPSDRSGQPPVEQEHRDDRRGGDREVARQRARGVGHDRLDAADVVRQPALDLAGPRLGEEAQRHPLEVAVQRRPEVLHDALADDVVEVRLADADEPGHDRDDDHQPDVQVQLVEVVADDDVVDEQLEQVRVDQPEEARAQDRDEDDARPGTGTAGRTRRSSGAVRQRRSGGIAVGVARPRGAGSARAGCRRWRRPSRCAALCHVENSSPRRYHDSRGGPPADPPERDGCSIGVKENGSTPPVDAPEGIGPGGRETSRAWIERLFGRWLTYREIRLTPSENEGICARAGITRMAPRPRPRSWTGAMASAGRGGRRGCRGRGSSAGAPRPGRGGRRSSAGRQRSRPP